MKLSSFASVAAAFVGVSAAQAEHSPQAAAPQVTIVEANKSYVVRLECPDCPYLARDGENHAWLKRENSLLFKFYVEDSTSTLPTMSLNGAQVLPLASMPLFINAYQVAANDSQDLMDSIEHMFNPDFAVQTRYNHFPVQYEHALLKTKTPGQWWLQLDVQSMQWGRGGETVFDENRKIVQILVKEQKRENDQGRSLSIQDVQVVESNLREQPIKMKCGKPAMVKTFFNPKEWDEYGKLGSWSHAWNMVFGKIGQYWRDNIQHNALLLPLALLLAFVIFFARVWCQRRQQDKSMDAEYALVETMEDDLPPAYSDIPVIKIEEYD